MHCSGAGQYAFGLGSPFAADTITPTFGIGLSDEKGERDDGLLAAANGFQIRRFSTPILSLGLPGPDRFRQIRHVNQAFILGAGLGTRLRPLTDRLPKPLIPLFHRPLAAWAMDACRAAGIRTFAINTHHLPEEWESADCGPVLRSFSEEGLRIADWKKSEEVAGNGLFSKTGHWDGLAVDLFHEPILLETGGGLKNIAAWIGNEPLLIHNGDIFSTLPLGELIAAHAASGLPVTLAVRSEGEAKHLALDATVTRVTDIREKLGRAPGTHVFTGIYCISPEFLDLIPVHEKVSVIPAFLELAAAGRLGSVVLDEGVWMDLGDRPSYLQAHRDLDLGPTIHPEASVSPGAILERSVVGPGAFIESGAILRDSIVWPGCHVTSGAELDGCIIFSGAPVTGKHRDADL